MMTFDEIYILHHPKILRYLVKIVGAGHAEDLVQEVFIKVNAGLGSLKDEKKLAPWLYRIALNTARDHVRSMKSKTPAVSLDGEADCGGCRGTPGTERIADTKGGTHQEAVERRDMIECYLDYVEKLPKNYYNVYVLSEIEELANEEIAARLSLSVDTVKIRLHRARTKLFEELRKNCSSYCNRDGSVMCEPKG